MDRHHEGEPASPTVYLVGGGPSLRGFDWSRLENRNVIAINKAALDGRVPWTRMLSMDLGFWKLHGADVESVADGRPCVHVCVGDEKLPEHGPTVVVPCCVPCCVHEGPNPHLVAAWGRNGDVGCGGSSGYAALNYAAEIGYTWIVLLGYDCRGDGRGGQAWWHDGYPWQQSEAVYERQLAAFRDGVPPEVRERVRVVGPSRLIDEGVFRAVWWDKSRGGSGRWPR